MQYMIRDVERLHGVRATTLGGVVENIAHDAQHVAPAFLGRQITFYAVRIEQQTHLVAVADRGKRQQAGKLRGQIAFAQARRSEISGCADVHQQQDREFALLGEFLDERPAGARRDIPVDGSHFIARAVFAHFVEVHAAALEYRLVGAGQAVVDHAARADLELAHAAHHGLVGFAAILRHYGTGSALSIFSMTFSEEIFSASASYVTETRWRSTSRAIDFTSCGMTKWRPFKNAMARAPSVSAMVARGEAPVWM